MRLPALARKHDTVLVFAGALIFSVWLHNLLGLDGFWDTANYHIYLGWAFWNAPSYTFGAAAQYQTFLNPVIDGVNYALFTTHPFVGAAFHSVCMALAVVALYRIMVNALDPGESRYGPVFAVAIGATGAMFVSLFGSFTNEHITALLIVTALCLIVSQSGTMSERARMVVTGLLLGVATGLKLTAAPYAAGLLVAVAFAYRFHFKILCFMVGGIVVGLLVTDGIFMVLRWRIYHNPIFPLANNIFHSQYFPGEWKSFGHFELKLLPYYLSLPMRWLYSGDMSESPIMRDGRLLLGYIGLALTSLSAVFQNKPLRREERLVVFFFVFSWLAWILFFRIYRYVVVLELLSGAVFVIGLLRFIPVARIWLRLTVLVLACGCLYYVTVYPDWGRRSWGDHFATSELRKLLKPDKTDVVFFADERVSYLAADLNEMEIPFRNLFSQSWYDGDRNGNPTDPHSFGLSKRSKAYFVSYSMDDPRLKSPYLAGLFNRHQYQCRPVPTNMVWNPFLCSFEVGGIPEIELGRAYDYVEPELGFGAGWSGAETGFRWTDGRTASLKVLLPALPAACTLVVTIKGHTLGKQRIALTVANHGLVNQVFAGPVDMTAQFDTAAFVTGRATELTFSVPDAVSPGENDPRLLAFAMHGVQFDCK